MDNQTPINGKARRQRRLPRVVEDVALGFEERVIWPAGDALRTWILWPLQDRLPLLDRAHPALAVGGVAVVAAAIGVAAAFWASAGGSGEPAANRVAASDQPVERPAPEQPVKTAESPTLQGAAPVFEPAKRGGSSELDKARSVDRESARSAASDSASTSSAASEEISSSPANASSSASAASVDGPPAGAKAISVARRFAGAFVVYETGGEKASVRKALAATATPELARSLLRRPPRQPANVEVPKAKVLNVVAGPSSGGVYSVSVSLLRVGLTSELRLDMEKLENDGWRVTNVLG